MRSSSRAASTSAATGGSGSSTRGATRTSTSSRRCPTSPSSSRSTATGAFILHPGEFVLGATLERLGLPDDLVARLDGKSSLGRLGLQVHSTAGLADPGFEGQITLELSNVASLPIAIYPGMRIAQLVFERLTTPADAPYGHERLGSKYQGQSGPTASEYWRNFSHRVTPRRSRPMGRGRPVHRRPLGPV